MLPVAVEIAPPNPPREQVTVLLSACARAVEADCVLASEVPVGGTQAVAIVTWQTDARALVEVGMHTGGRAEWRSRNLRFSPKDEPIERWRTVGFVIGVLARGDTPSQGSEGPSRTESGEGKGGTPAEASSASKPVQSAPATSKPAAAPSAKTPKNTAGTGSTNGSSAAEIDEPGSGFFVPSQQIAKASIDLGVAVGPSLDGVRRGAVLRTRWPLWLLSRVVVSGKYTSRPADNTGLGARWLTFGAGLAASIGSGEVELSASLEGRAQYFQVDVNVERTPGHDSAWRWLPGVGGSLVGVWMPTSRLGLWIGADGEWMFGQTNLYIGNDVAPSDKPLHLGFEGGVRVKLW